MVVGVTVDVLVIIFSVLAFILLLALFVLFCVCIYRMCAERWRKRHEYDLATQFESGPPPTEDYPPPEYHNLALSTGLVSTNEQAASRNRGTGRGTNYRSMSQAERTSDANRNRTNDGARETLLSDVSNDGGDQSDHDDT